MGNYANFYNSKNGDRKYDSESFAEWLRPFFKTGVFNGSLQVLANNDMTVKVEVGYAYIDGRNKFFDSMQTLTVEAAHSTLKRIDNVVVRRNDIDRDFNILIQKGSFASVPTAPTPIRSGGIYDLVIAQINIDAAAPRITQSNIVDTRMNSDICGWVVSNISEIPFDQIASEFNQFKTEKTQEFNNWFSNIQSILDSNAAGNLHTRIEEVNTTLGQQISVLQQEDININSQLVNATSNQRGFVKVGKTLSITSDGVLNTKVVTLTKTLLVSGWINNIYDLEIAEIKESSEIEILPIVVSRPTPTTTEIENNEALNNANFQDAGQSDGHAYIYAENPPTKNVQVRVIVKG